MKIETIEDGLKILRELQCGDASILDDKKIEFSKDFILKIELPAPPHQRINYASLYGGVPRAAEIVLSVGRLTENRYC